MPHGHSSEWDTSDMNIGSPVTNFPGAWRYLVSAATSLPGVSIL